MAAGVWTIMSTLEGTLESMSSRLVRPCEAASVHFLAAASIKSMVAASMHSSDAASITSLALAAGRG